VFEGVPQADGIAKALALWVARHLMPVALWGHPVMLVVPAVVINAPIPFHDKACFYKEMIDFLFEAKD
jgi:hypothetical protein